MVPIIRANGVPFSVNFTVHCTISSASNTTRIVTPILSSKNTAQRMNNSLYIRFCVPGISRNMYYIGSSFNVYNPDLLSLSLSQQGASPLLRGKKMSVSACCVICEQQGHFIRIPPNTGVYPKLLL